MIENVVGKDYKLVKKLGSGAFGQVFQAIHTKNHTEYAVKLQKANTKSPQLFYEAKILNSFALEDNVTSDYGIPRVYYCGTQGQYNVMVMDLCGKSLEELFNSCGKKLDLKTTLIIALQMIQRVEFIHNRAFLHRDIKPDNFVVGFGKKSSKLFLIDFGLAKKYLLKDGSHIPYKDTKNLTGTARFASLNTHLGIEQGRRDDIEGIANVLIYLHKGSVPWQNLRANNKKQKYQKIMQKKLSVPIDKICEGMSDQFSQLLNYSRTLEFQQTPDYGYLKDLFRNALKREGFTLDYKYCWDK